MILKSSAVFLPVVAGIKEWQLQFLVGSDDKHCPAGERHTSLVLLHRVHHSVEIGDVTLGIGKDGVGEISQVPVGFNVLNETIMIRQRAAGQSNDLNIPLLQLRKNLLNTCKFRGADRGEILRMTEEAGPFVVLWWAIRGIWWFPEWILRWNQGQFDQGSFSSLTTAFGEWLSINKQTSGTKINLVKSHWAKGKAKLTKTTFFVVSSHVAELEQKLASLIPQVSGVICKPCKQKKTTGEFSTEYNISSSLALADW